MGNIFGKKPSRSSKQPAITEQDRAILVKINSKKKKRYNNESIKVT